MLVIRLIPLFMPVFVLSGIGMVYSDLSLSTSVTLFVASILSLSYAAWNYEAYIQTVKLQKSKLNIFPHNKSQSWNLFILLNLFLLSLCLFGLGILILQIIT